MDGEPQFRMTATLAQARSPEVDAYLDEVTRAIWAAITPAQWAEAHRAAEQQAVDLALYGVSPRPR